jgi:RimJ/RimL family protein N-acetyltransferase/GNAT superfamily N-acetyltransferase
VSAIRRCRAAEAPAILAIVNAAAEAYRGVIPADRWHEPYMDARELDAEIAAGVEFWGYEADGELIGAMGIQRVRDVDLIRHAYVLPASQRSGVGGALLEHLLDRTDRRMLVGTWAAAEWAVGFYERHGFELVPPRLKDELLRTYWTIPDRQIETSVVLACPPFVVVETERLLLRPIGIGDLDDYLALHDEPDVARFVTRLEGPAAEERLRGIEREWAERGHGTFAVLERATGRFIGRAGLRYWPQFDETELGWVIRREEWGNEYATEAGHACAEWGFSNLSVPYLTAMIEPRNAASIRVARRLNMEPMRDDVLLGWEIVVYAVSRGDWSRTNPER